MLRGERERLLRENLLGIQFHQLTTPSQAPAEQATDQKEEETNDDYR
jgi:hypothetical protein